MSNWLYYRTLTIDHGVIDSSLTDYPVMVKLDDTNFDFSKIRSNGYDLIFMDSSGTTQLKHEVELFDGVNEKAVYHVKIPSISDTVDTTFRMYYGDSSITTDQSDKTNVWDSNFVMVQHMGDSLIDSTGNGNDGTNYGSTVVDGLNGKTRSFDGGNYISIPTSKEVFNYNPEEVQFQFIYKPTDLSMTYVFETRDSEGKWAYSFRHENSTEIRFYINTSIRDDLFASHSMPITSYSNVLLTRVEGGDAKININGSMIASSQTSGTALSYLMHGINLGSDRNYKRGFEGLIDEFRISNIARSDAWIKADDYNLRTYSLLSLGTETSNKTIIGIELLQEPTKTEYFLGESLDLTGAILEITYDDLSTQQIEPISASGFDSSVESLSQTVTISLGGFSESFNVAIRNDYTVGQVITIKFTDSIVAASIDGNISAFTVTGKEYQWVDGPDNNGPLIDKEYQVVAVVPHPTLDDKHIRIIFDDYSRFPSVVGDITVEYDASLGNLAGSGGVVESFSVSFLPTDLIPKPNPAATDKFTVSPTINIDFIKVIYNNRYGSVNLIATADCAIDFIPVEDINP